MEDRGPSPHLRALPPLVVTAIHASVLAAGAGVAGPPEPAGSRSARGRAMLVRMTSSSVRARVISAALFVVTAVLGTGCDLGTKHWAETTLRDAPGQSLSVIAPHLDLSLRYNEGTAFSIVPDLGTTRAILGGFALFVALALLVVSIRSPESRMRTLALGLIAGGAIGNGVDRIVRTGVVDFIQLNYPWGGSWPSFNVADVLVAVGAALLVLQAWRDAREAPTSTAD